MATVYIDGSATTSGSGTSYTDPLQAVPALTNGNTYLFAEGSTNTLTNGWTNTAQNVLLGTYSRVNGAQIFDKNRAAKVTNLSTGTGTVSTIVSFATVNLRVQCLEILNGAPNATNRMGVYNNGTSDGLEITDCIIHGMRGTTGTHNGIQLAGTSNTRAKILRNTVYDIGEDGIWAQAAAGILIEENIVATVSQDNSNGDCCQLTGDVSNFVVRNNYFSHLDTRTNKQCFIASGMTGVGGLFEGNICYQARAASSGAVYVDGNSIIVRRNYIQGGSYGMELASANGIVEANVIYAGEDSWPGYLGCRIAVVGGILVRHNVFIGRMGTPESTSIGIWNPAAGVGADAKNNIIMGFGTGITKTNMTESFNCFYNNTANGLTPTSGVLTNPLLDRDFMPHAAAVLAAGTPIPGTADYHGRPYRQTPNIGAMETIALPVTTRTSRTVVSARSVTERPRVVRKRGNFPIA